MSCAIFGIGQQATNVVLGGYLVLVTPDLQHPALNNLKNIFSYFFSLQLWCFYSILCTAWDDSFFFAALKLTVFLLSPPGVAEASFEHFALQVCRCTAASDSTSDSKSNSQLKGSSIYPDICPQSVQCKHAEASLIRTCWSCSSLNKGWRDVSHALSWMINIQESALTSNYTHSYKHTRLCQGLVDAWVKLSYSAHLFICSFCCNRNFILWLIIWQWHGRHYFVLFCMSFVHLNMPQLIPIFSLCFCNIVHLLYRKGFKKTFFILFF